MSMKSTCTSKPDSDENAAHGAGEESSRTFSQLWGKIGAIVGSTTFVTAILFYFGWSRGYYFYNYLGVDSSLLGLTTQDYVQLSVDGLFVPLIIVACLTLLAVWSHLMLERAGFLRHRRRAVGRLLSILGLVLMCNGLSRILTSTPINSGLTVAPLSLGVGTLLLVNGRRMAGTGSRNTATTFVPLAELAVVLTLVGLSLFWIANDYSAAVGVSRARQFVRELPSLPEAVIYSAKDLGLKADGVHEQRCNDPSALYRFRYDGLKLVLQSGDEYLFLPTAWTRSSGIALLLPKGPNIRLEFSPPGVETDRPYC